MLDLAHRVYFAYMSASKDCKYTMWYVNNSIPDEDGLLMVSLPSFLSDCLDGSLDIAL